MQYRSAKGLTGWAQFGILVAFLGAGMILAGALQLYLGMKALGPSNIPITQRGDAMVKALMKPENSNYAQLSQILGTFFLLFLPAIAYILICHKKISWAGFNRYFNWKQVALGFVIILCTTLFANPFADFTKAILAHYPTIDALAKNAENLYNEMVQSMSQLHTWPQFITGVFIIAFLPALFEEFFFRGTIQNLFVRWWKKPVLAIVFTSLLFSLVHSSYYLFISRFILGFSLGWMFYRSRNIWINIFAHFMNNLLALIQLFYLNRKGGKIDVSNMDAKMEWWSVFISLAFLIGLFIVFERLSSKNREIIRIKEATAIETDNPFFDIASE